MAGDPFGTRGGWISRSIVSRDGRATVTKPITTTASNPRPRRSKLSQSRVSPVTRAATPARRAASPNRVIGRPSGRYRAGHRNRLHGPQDDLRAGAALEFGVRLQDDAVGEDDRRHLLDVLGGDERPSLGGRAAAGGAQQRQAAAGRDAEPELRHRPGGGGDRDDVLLEGRRDLDLL